MILRIFKKDCALLWPFALLIAALQAVNAMVWIKLGHFGEPMELRMLADLLSMVAPLAPIVLVVVAVHQDAIPGVNQDWLVRPIPRADLLFAKLLFVIATQTEWRCKSRS